MFAPFLLAAALAASPAPAATQFTHCAELAQVSVETFQLDPSDPNTPAGASALAYFGASIIEATQDPSVKPTDDQLDAALADVKACTSGQSS